MEEYEYALICEDSIDGILSGIYEAYQIKKEEQIDSHDRIHLLTEEPYIQRLSCYYQHIETDRGKAEKVIRTLKKEFGESGFYDLCLAMVSKGEEKADAVYHTVVLGLRTHDKRILERLHVEAVSRTFSYYRRTSRELNHWREFLRFEELENGILYARITPKSDILTFLIPHFADRLPADNFIIYDENRGIFGLHPQFHDWYLVTHQNFDTSMLHFSQNETIYRELFTCFCQSVAIQERKNPGLQMNMLPKWFRPYMVEFR